MGQEWREDASNRDLAGSARGFASSSCRCSSVMYLPRVVEHLAGLAELAREEEDFWNALVEDRFGVLVRDESRRTDHSLRRTCWRRLASHERLAGRGPHPCARFLNA